MRGTKELSELLMPDYRGRVGGVGGRFPTRRAYLRWWARSRSRNRRYRRRYGGRLPSHLS